MSDSQKITINVGAVDLGKMDLLVQEGFYSSRTDFIRAAIRSQLERQSVHVNELIRDNRMSLGILEVGKSDLERAKSLGQRLNFHVIGMLILKKDVTPELALEVIDSIKVTGVFRARDELKEALQSVLK